MKLVSVAHRKGDLKVSNKDVIQLIKEQSTKFNGDLQLALDKVSTGLNFTGFDERRWMPENQNLFDTIVECAQEAINDFKIEEIKTLIYVGVGRNFLEPATSALIAKKLGINPHCFDIIEACQSWTRACFLVDGLYKGGALKGKTLIINCEVHAQKGISGSKDFGIKNMSDLEWKFPCYTMGDSITASVVEPNNENHAWQWENISEIADYCYLPLPGAEDYKTENKINNQRHFSFYSFGKTLHQKLSPLVVNCANRLFDENAGFTPDIVFTHTSSKRTWDDICVQLGVSNKVYHIIQQTGNLVSASVPTAISMAEQEGALKRGDNALVIFAAAGGSALAYKFKY
tara:strand:- start:2264 stop:3295 length:1032 start_codon:yes stop_codon:yes gene_type:complete